MRQGILLPQSSSADSLTVSVQSPCAIIILRTIKRISRTHIYRSSWERRAPYNNTNNTHSHTDVGGGWGGGGGVGMAVVRKFRNSY